MKRVCALEMTKRKKVEDLTGGGTTSTLNPLSLIRLITGETKAKVASQREMILQECLYVNVCLCLNNSLPAGSM